MHVFNVSVSLITNNMVVVIISFLNYYVYSQEMLPVEVIGADRAITQDTEVYNFTMYMS